MKDIRKKLIRGIEEISEKNIMFLCFPYAGGAASAYQGWKKYVEEEMKLCSIQLPGREERYGEVPYEDIYRLAQDIFYEIKEYPGKNIIFFGHSMGAKIAYETAVLMETYDNPIRLLVVSGSRCVCEKEKFPKAQLSREDFKNVLIAYDGIPKEILENDAILDFFIPMIRNDFKMDEAYIRKEIKKIESDIYAISGKQDGEVGEVELLKWADCTNGKFEYELFEGNHFYIHKFQKEICKKIVERIEK